MRKYRKYEDASIKKSVVYDGNVTLLPHGASIEKDVATYPHLIYSLLTLLTCNA